MAKYKIERVSGQTGRVTESRTVDEKLVSANKADMRRSGEKFNSDTYKVTKA